MNELMSLLKEILPLVTWPGSVVVTGILLYKAGVFSALASRLRGQVTDISKQVSDEIKGFAMFQKTAEENHFHDLAALLEWSETAKDNQKQLWVKVNELAGMVSDVRVKVARIEGKVFNGNRES